MNENQSVYLSRNDFINWDDVSEKAKEWKISKSKLVSMGLERLFLEEKNKRFRKNWTEIMSGVTFALVVLIFVKALIT